MPLTGTVSSRSNNSVKKNSTSRENIHQSLLEKIKPKEKTLETIVIKKFNFFIA